MTPPQTLTEQGFRDSLVRDLYELGDCLAAIGTYLLVFDGPTDDIDLDELLTEIQLDAVDAVGLWAVILPRLVLLIEGSE